MKKSLILMACVSMVALALVACHRENGFSAGTEMNADEIRAYREKLLAENLSEGTPPESTPHENEPQESEPPESTPSEPDLSESEEKNDPEDGESQELPDVCYYVENGSVWHASESCSYLKNSKNIIKSDPEGAEAAGKERPCSKCASNWK